MIQNSESQNYNRREYAVNSVTNRNTFEALEFAETLRGKQESFQSLYRQSIKLEEYAQAQLTLTGKRTVTGYKGSVASDILLIDVDVKNDLPKAQLVARQLLERITREYGVDPAVIHCRFSGFKGFHIELPAALFGGFASSERLPEIQSALVRKICTGFEAYVDLDIYFTVSFIRIENTKHSKSDSFSIPLSVEEVHTLTIDQIKEMAQTPRYLELGTKFEIQPIQRLVDIKLECESTPMQAKVTPVASGPLATSAPADSISYTAAKPEKMCTMCNRCAVLAAIEKKATNGEPINHAERLTIGTVFTAFGKEGTVKIHDLLKNQANYDQQKTDYYIANMAQNAYKPEACLTICGKDNMCQPMKDINRKSPIAFAYTYDEKIDTPINKYVEQYMVEKVVAHFTNMVYSAGDQTFYKYEDGVYSAISDGSVKCLLENFLPYYLPTKLITNRILESLVDRLKSQRKMLYDGKFNTEMYRVNLKNGIFNLRTGTLEPHNQNFMSNIQLPFAYDPKAQSPVFDKFLSEIFNNEQEVLDYILKVWAYLMLPTYSFQKIFIWIGSGRNGKGTLGNLITKMLGKRNVSNEDIHELVRERFSTINLKDKLVNFSTELRTDELDLAMLKKLSGGDNVSADVKFKDKVGFQNTARLIIMGNELPRFSELGNAILQRFEIISFPNEYNDAQTDTALPEKLEAELAGIFNKLVAVMPTIFDERGAINFAAPECITRNKQAALSELSTVIEYVKDHFSLGEGMEQQSVTLKDLYDGYRTWAVFSGYRAVGKKTMNGTLKNTLKLRVDSNPQDDNKVHVYGIMKK